ncbi:hypothetical protein CXIVA_11430 [Clostridium sp. SY8519]|nr:hypothetical protein CXIVA_11430 [Clostridium sp. SY8519]
MRECEAWSNLSKQYRNGAKTRPSNEEGAGQGPRGIRIGGQIAGMRSMEQSE